jgi:class 3 adenylate cyclase/tetratricopeptide (TPR) repeat protein
LNGFLPSELASKLEATRTGRNMQGERRIITMLFCDVTGSAAAAEKLDPEEWTEIINGAFEQMIQPVYKYEGHVPRLMGDAILAFFGAPIAHEDDPHRAVLAGLEIQTGIQPYIEKIQAQYGVGFALRVGINTGLVVVGDVGSDLRMEYTAIGDAINLAARMEQTAAPGTVQISEETYKLVAPFFEFEAIGGVTVKGKAEPVNSYRVLSVKKTPGQLRGLQGLSSPLVGRETELSVLEESLNSLQNGQGSIVTILGEAGLGKSSLVSAAHEHLKYDAALWLEAHALSYTRSIGYFSWRQILRASIGALESDSPSEVREKLGSTCERYKLPDVEIPFLEAILGVESQESLGNISNYQGDALLKRFTETTSSYLCTAAREAPLVITFDDLHWVDEASLTLLSNLIEIVKENPVVFLCIMRPDQDAPAWEFNQRIQRDLPACYRQIELHPFSNETTNALLINLLGTDDIPETLFKQIIKKAEGNPFFVEEIIRSLIETDQIVRQNGGWQRSGKSTRISLPNTLTGVLNARIDRLPDESKQVLHFASVIGREIDLKLLSAISGEIQNFGAHIQKLEDVGLFQLVSAIHTPEYRFRHALLHEAAYNSILLKERRSLHVQIGEILEGLHPDRLNEFAPLLAHHFFTARDSRSLQYDVIAGESAARLYANEEAAAHFSHALETALRINSSHEQIKDLYTKLGQALELSGRYDEALENYSAMESYGLDQDIPSMQLAALLAKSTLYSTYTSLYDFELGEQLIHKALKLSKEIGDRATQVKLHWNLMVTYLFSNRVAQALEHGKHALPLARESGDCDQLAFILNDLGRVYACQGKFEQVYSVCKEARQIWGALENETMLADSLGAEASARFQAGDHTTALELLNQGLRLSEKNENLWGQSYSHWIMSLIHFDLGNIRYAMQISKQGISEGDQAGLIASSIASRAELGWHFGYYGAPEKGFEAAEKALQIVDEKQQPSFRNFPLAIIVRLHLMKGDLESAQKIAGPTPLQPIPIPYSHYTIIVRLANVELALARADHAHALSLVEELLKEVTPLTRTNIPQIFQHKARALMGLNRLDEAHQVLIQASSLAEETGSKHHLWSIYLDLAELNTSLDQLEAADVYRKKARPIVEKIAAGLEEIDLGQSFLKMPRVRDLLCQ